MDLIIYFDKNMLTIIKDDLIRLTSLHSIGIIEFCYVLLKNIKKYWNKELFDDNLIGMLCQIYDCVDVDSRGIIDWDDFLSFTLRSGRNRFKAVSGYSNIEYIQRTDVPLAVPMRQLYFCSDLQIFFAFDGDLPVIRVFRKTGEFAGSFNPVAAIVRMMRVRALGKQPYYAQKKTLKVNAASKNNSSKKISEWKGTVTAMAFIERKRQMAIATSDCYLSFWNSRLQHLVDFVETEIPQMGMMYCAAAEVLVSWPGDSDDYDFRIWDINNRVLKFKLPLHYSMIFKTIEVREMGLMVSSSMDRSLLVWPSSLLVKYDTPDFEEFRHEFDSIPLTGHIHVIRSLAYAPHNELILGAGFDYDVYGWDPTTKTLQIKLIGHRHSVVGVAIVHNPLERAATVDEAGSIKIWNIDRSQGFRAQHLQSLSTQAQSQINVISFTPILSHGGTLAVLAERLYFFDLLGGGLEDSRCVSGGLVITEQIGKLYVIGRKLAFESNLKNGVIGKVFDVISEERIDSCTTARVTSRLAAGIKKIANLPVSSDIDEQLLAHQSVIVEAVANPKDIYIDDDITAAAADLNGKKMFIGTHCGKVLLLDTTTIGILMQLTHEESSISRESQGPITKMCYCNQNELLVVAHAGGAIKIFSACHRTISQEQREKYLSKKSFKSWCPYLLGGNTPSSPLLLRSNNLVHETTILSMAVSEELGLIAVSGSDGTVRVIDFYTLLIRNVYSVPYISRQPVECTHLCFIPGAALLLGADSHSRLTLWTVYPLQPLWIYTWVFSHGSQLHHDIAEFEEGFHNGNGSISIFETTDEPIDEIELNSPEKYTDNNDDLNNFGIDEDAGIGITCIDCVVWKNNDYQNIFQQKDASSTKNGINTRIEWTVIIGDSVGRVTLLDITEILIRIGASDFSTMRQTAFLHRNSSPFHQCRRKDLKDGLEEFQIKELIKLLKQPIGMLGVPDSNQAEASSLKGRIGYKGTSTKDLKRRARWAAHMHSVAEVRALQHHLPNNLDSDIKNYSRRKMSLFNKFASLDNKPYAIVTLSEFGIPKKWSWRGIALDEETNFEIDPTSELTADFQNLFSALNSEKHIITTSDDQSSNDIIQVPTGASQERVSGILRWVLHPLREYYESRLAILAPVFNELQKSPLLTSRQTSRSEKDRPTSASLQANRRTSVSEIIWTNQFVDMAPKPLDELESVSSGQTFITNGLEKSENAQEMTVEELDDKNIEKIRQSARLAGIGGNDLNIFVREIAAIKKKVDHLKERQEFTIESWNSKSRFPNLEGENIRKESHLVNKITDLMAPPTRGKGTESYEIFLKEREMLIKKTIKNLPNQEKLKKIQKKKPYSSTLDQLESINDERRTSILTSIRHSDGIASLSEQPSNTNISRPQTGSNHSNLRKMIKNDEDEKNDSDDEVIINSKVIRTDSRPSTAPHDQKRNIQKTMKRFEQLMRSETPAYTTWNSTIAEHDSATNKTAKKEKSKSRIRDHNSILVSSEPIKKQDSAVHGRYGPYKTKDIIAFEDFMAKLPIKAKQMDPESTERIISDYFPDTMALMQMNTPYDHRELCHLPEIIKSKSIARLITSIRDRKDGIIIRGDIFNAVFPFASEAEKVRIYTYAIVRAVLYDVLRCLRPSNCSNLTGHEDGQFSPVDKMRLNTPLQKNSPKRVQTTPNQLFQQNSPTRSTMRIKRKNSGLEGWKLEKWIFDDMKKFFDDLYNDMNGTLIGSEIIDLIQNSSVINSLDKIPNYNFIATKKNFPLTSEIHGNLIGLLFEDILKVDIVEEVPKLVTNQNEGLSTSPSIRSPKRAIELKRLLTRSFDMIMQDDTSQMDVGTLSNFFKST